MEAEPVGDIEIRDARDTDGYAVTALVSACWAEYPGCILDVEGEEPQLRSLATYYAGREGRCWVVVLDGLVVASVACHSSEEAGGLELKLLYVLRPARRRGLAAELSALVETEARQRDASFVELWTDSRFEDAHRFYERRGYVRGPTRERDDISRSIEYHYRLELLPD